MANTGYKQAKIAYKTSPINGEPLDVNGEPTALSGNRQAIAVIEGLPNPDPALYEIELYFEAGAELGGVPSVRLDLEACPIGQTDPWTIEDASWHDNYPWRNYRIWEY